MVINLAIHLEMTIEEAVGLQFLTRIPLELKRKMTRLNTYQSAKWKVVKETHEITYLFINIYLDRVVCSVHILFFIEPCNKTIKIKIYHKICKH